MSSIITITFEPETPYTEGELEGLREQLVEILNNNNEGDEVIESMEVACKTQEEIDAENLEIARGVLDKSSVTISLGIERGNETLLEVTANIED